MIFITSLIYPGVLQIIFHKIIGALFLGTKKPMLKCTEGMLKKVFSKKPTIWALDGLFLPETSQHFLKNQQ